jgi:transposase
MADVHMLRHKVLIKGLSQRQVAREMRLSRNTVRRYLTLPEPMRTETAPRRRPSSSRYGPGSTPCWTSGRRSRRRSNA